MSVIYLVWDSRRGVPRLLAIAQVQERSRRQRDETTRVPNLDNPPITIHG